MVEGDDKVGTSQLAYVIKQAVYGSWHGMIRLLHTRRPEPYRQCFGYVSPAFSHSSMYPPGHTCVYTRPVARNCNELAMWGTNGTELLSGDLAPPRGYYIFSVNFTAGSRIYNSQSVARIEFILPSPHLIFRHLDKVPLGQEGAILPRQTAIFHYPRPNNPQDMRLCCMNRECGLWEHPGQPGVTMQACQRCGFAFYCSPQCANSHRPEHAAVCRDIQRRRPVSLPMA